MSSCTTKQCHMPTSAHLLLVDCGQHRGRDDRGRDALVHGTPGDDQLHPVATLSEDLCHLVAAHAVQIRVADSQDVVAAVQVAILERNIHHATVRFTIYNLAFSRRSKFRATYNGR